VVDGGIRINQMNYQKHKDLLLKNPMYLMLLGLLVLFGGVFGWKTYTTLLLKHELASMSSPPVTVSTMKINFSNWQPTLKSVGSLRSVLEVNLTCQLAGMIEKIYFSPGATVKKNELLVELNPSNEIAQLDGLKAQVELAKITYHRDQAQYEIHGVSKQTVETDDWSLKDLQAQMANAAATLEKKMIRAPFSGRLGISKINPGQFLNPGDIVTSLQTFDPIYIDFYLPQQALNQIKTGQEVVVTTNAYPEKLFKGKITTIEPNVNIKTRNVEVEATIPNPQNKLISGMYASVNVIAQKSTPYLTLPQSAISYNSYGDFVYIVESKKTDKKTTGLFAKQKFITTGMTRGDQIAVLTGLKPGETIVTSGQLKLKNGNPIKVNNTVQLSNNPDPKITDQ
jgi:membrane fusion protein (multidrug efflux system)